MRRRLFNFAASVSLVLCLAVVALWVRSYWHDDGLEWQSGNSNVATDWLIGSSGGKLCYTRIPFHPIASEGHFEPQRLHGASEVFEPLGTDPTVTKRHFLGFAMITWGDTSLYRIGFLAVPYWAIATLLLVLPALAIVRQIRHRRRVSAGRCRRCGYSLAHNISGVCPECGTPIAGRAGVKA